MRGIWERARAGARMGRGCRLPGRNGVAIAFSWAGVGNPITTTPAPRHGPKNPRQCDSRSTTHLAGRVTTHSHPRSPHPPHSLPTRSPPYAHRPRDDFCPPERLSPPSKWVILFFFFLTEVRKGKISRARDARIVGLGRAAGGVYVDCGVYVPTRRRGLTSDKPRITLHPSSPIGRSSGAEMEQAKWDRIERLIRAGEYQSRLQAIREVYAEIVQLNTLLGQLLKAIMKGDDGNAIL